MSKCWLLGLQVLTFQSKYSPSALGGRGVVLDMGGPVGGGGGAAFMAGGGPGGGGP